MSEPPDSSRRAVTPPTPADFGLHVGVLGPVETLAQSVSTIAPSGSPSLLIPVIFALAGNATWFVFLLATGATLLVGFCVSRFARLSASPGSLYTYTVASLPPLFGAAAGWGLLLAYVAGAMSAGGGAIYFAGILAQEFLHTGIPDLLTLAVVCGATAWIAHRDITLSAELMLWIEVASVTVILVVLSLVPIRFGFHFDMDQLKLKGAPTSALGPALVLAMLSFTGFESATTLGVEARDPLRTIPRVVLQSAVLSGVFFMVCSYCEVLGFRGEASKLSDSTSPLHLLATRGGVAPLGMVADLGAMLSMFACVLASITAAARVSMRLAAAGLLPRAFADTSPRHGTPGVAIFASVGILFAATVAMIIHGWGGSEILDLAGSLAVFGYLTAYTLAAVALPFALRTASQFSLGVVALSVATVAAMIAIVVYDLLSATDPAHARIPYLFLAYLAAGLAWSLAKPRRRLES
jgi:amino acid transporter